MEKKLTAQDLQIGDWVVYNGDVEYSTPIKVEAMDIATDSLITSDRDDVGFDGVWPIPITPEILKNIGFEEIVATCHRYIFKEIGYYESVRVYTYEEPIIVVSVIDGNEFKGKIKYVHQLQQAMRLCKIRKEIEL